MTPSLFAEQNDKSKIKRYVVVVAFYLAFAIIFGAFGTHLLSDALDNKMLGIFKTANQYHFYATFGLFFIIIFMLLQNRKRLLYAWHLLFWGSVLFSFSLYLYATTGVKFLGIITPLGGIMMILAWIMTALAFFERKNP